MAEELAQSPDVKGNLFVVSGPSGAGKGTLVSRIRYGRDDVWVSISATTRKPRRGEIEGVHYYFLSDRQFEELIESNGLLEWAQVHGHYYGTPRSTVLAQLEAGKQVILEIDPQGAFQVREAFEDAILIFIMPPSIETLRKRLIARGTDDLDEIERRLQTAKVELARKDEYDVVVLNDDLDVATNELTRIIDSHTRK